MTDTPEAVDALIDMIISTYHTTRLADVPAALHIRSRLGDRLTQAIRIASNPVADSAEGLTPAKAKRTLLGIEIPRDELALRIAGKCIGLKPPAGTNATEALDQMNFTPGASGDGMGNGFRRAADAAVLYIHECINDARQPS